MATLIDKYFSGPDFDAIEATVAKAELSTSGEIAIEMASRSRDWTTERLIHALVLGVASGLVALYLTVENNWGTYYNFTQTLLWAGAGFLAAFFGWGQFLKRATRRQKVVWLRALDRFGRLSPVRGRAAVLIFVSLEEDEAAIVADTGIASKLPPDYWPSLRNTLVEAMKQGKHAEGIIATIETVATELAREFPRDDDDVNGLPDRPSIID